MKELTTDARVENIEAVTEFVNGLLRSFGCPLKVQMQLDVVIDEVVGNIAHYAYGTGSGPVTVRVERMEQPPAVLLTFIDRGTPYDPLAKQDPDTSLSAEERKIGGLGIYMVKKMTDAVSYEYRGGQNILTVTKNL